MDTDSEKESDLPSKSALIGAPSVAEFRLSHG
jgi:hypothetical protein